MADTMPDPDTLNPDPPAKDHNEDENPALVPDDLLHG